MRTLAICITFCLFAGVGWAAQTDGRIVVNRQDNAIELFVSMSGETLSVLTNVEDGFLADAAGGVDLNRFRTDTAHLGDYAFNPVTFEVGGRVVDAQAMALMMHSKENDVPFNSPWDALMAVTLCIAPEGAATVSLSDVQTYVGFSIFPIDGTDTLKVSFPEHGRADLQFVVVTFIHGRVASQQRVVLPDGKSLTFVAHNTFASSSVIAVWVLLIIGTATLGSLILYRAIITETSPMVAD